MRFLTGEIHLFIWKSCSQPCLLILEKAVSRQSSGCGTLEIWNRSAINPEYLRSICVWYFLETKAISQLQNKQIQSYSALCWVPKHICRIILYFHKHILSETHAENSAHLVATASALPIMALSSHCLCPPFHFICSP